MNAVKIAFVAIFLFACGTQPPVNLDAALPPAPPVVRLQSNVVYVPVDFFKKGETVISATDVALKSLNDVAGLRSTPIGTYSIVIRAYADTAKAIQPRMTVRLGKTDIGVVRVRRVVNDYTFPGVTGTGDTLRIILSDDHYDPVTKEDVNIHITKVTFDFGGGQGDAKLVWDANTESDLAGYNIYAGLSSRVYGSPVSVGLATNFPLTYNDGKTRYFAVTAFDTAANESDYSPEVVWTAPAPQDTTNPPEPKPDTTMVSWPDIKPLKMRIVYQKKDAAGKPLFPTIRLQMEKFDSAQNLGWLDRFPGADYTLTTTNDSTAIIEMNPAVLKAGIPQSGGNYIFKVRFRIRLENPTDATKSTPWVTSDKSIQLLVAVNPLEGVPLLPTFKIILE
jgi:hypothetical protein